MSENSILSQLSLISWLGPTRHPPRSLLRAVLVLVDLQDLRLFARETLGTNIMDMTTHDRVPYHFSRTDVTTLWNKDRDLIWTKEKCFVKTRHSGQTIFQETILRFGNTSKNTIFKPVHLQYTMPQIYKELL